MNKTRIVVEFEKKELTYLIDYLLEELRVWTEKGFESREEERQFQRTSDIVCRLRKAVGQNEAIFL